jgi:hypothetical protein
MYHVSVQINNIQDVEHGRNQEVLHLESALD